MTNFFDNNGLNSLTSSAFNKLMLEFGRGLTLTGGLAGIYGIRHRTAGLQKQQGLLEQQSQLQLGQIQAAQDAADIDSMQQAGQTFGKQLAAASVSGASLASGAVNAALNNTFMESDNRLFVNRVNANTARINALFQRKAEEDQVMEEKQANGLGALSSLLQTGIGLSLI